LGQIHFLFSFSFYFHELGPAHSWVDPSSLTLLFNVGRWICSKINPLNDERPRCVCYFLLNCNFCKRPIFSEICSCASILVFVRQELCSCVSLTPQSIASLRFVLIASLATRTTVLRSDKCPSVVSSWRIILW
jgi:hypothetical protein